MLPEGSRRPTIISKPGFAAVICQNSVFDSLPSFAVTFPADAFATKLSHVESVATAVAALNRTSDGTYQAGDASSALF
jgi:hypothetical protein